MSTRSDPRSVYSTPSRYPVLWASAFVLIALILVQLGRPLSPSLQADMLVHNGEYTMLTMRGRPEARTKETDALVLVDVSEGWMLMYELVGNRPNRTIQALDGGPLAWLFERGRSTDREAPQP